MSQRPFKPDPKPIKKAKKDLRSFAVFLERLAKRKPQKPIPKTSDKRKEKLKEYTPLRKQYLLDHPNCEIKLIGCEGKAVEIHHCSMSDKDFLNTSTWKGGCRHCHDLVERALSAIDRREKGLLIMSLELSTKKLSFANIMQRNFTRRNETRKLQGSDRSRVLGLGFRV
jgi:hypothetical protein